jgi:hypothetical protein
LSTGRARCLHGIDTHQSAETDRDDHPKEQVREPIQG